MMPWTKISALVAAALCCSLTLGTSTSRADERDDRFDPPRNETPRNHVNDDDDFNVEPSREDAEHRLDNVDSNWHRHDFNSCFSYCDDIRDSCISRFDDGYGRWFRGGRRRWDNRHGWSDRYRRCERRFDYCIEVCRDTRFDYRGR